MTHTLVQALRILYVDGVVADLRERERAEAPAHDGRDSRASARRIGGASAPGRQGPSGRAGRREPIARAREAVEPSHSEVIEGRGASDRAGGRARRDGRALTGPWSSRRRDAAGRRVPARGTDTRCRWVRDGDADRDEPVPSPGRKPRLRSGARGGAIRVGDPWTPLPRRRAAPAATPYVPLAPRLLW